MKSTIIINKEKSYWELKESVRMIKNQKTDSEKNVLIEDGGRISALMKLLNEQ